MYTHLRDRKFYENMYDRHTVEWGRRDLKSFLEFRDEWFRMMPDEKPDSLRSSFNLNWIYMMMCGNNLVDRYYGRDEAIKRSMARDEAKDQRITEARLKSEPLCQHCKKEGLRIIDKSLVHRGENYSHNDPERVLFMLKCTHCEKNSAFWEDGTEWERTKTKCPKCQATMKETTKRLKKSIKTFYVCSSCSHSYQDRLSLDATKTEKPDPDFEEDLRIFCLKDKKSLDEHVDAKQRFEGMVQLGKELKEREDNKHIYDEISEVTKLKIPELATVLAPATEKAGYTEFRLEQPNIGREVTIEFSCLDNKPDREDYDSRKTLKKTINKALDSTNWRLMSAGISYRLGYLTGSLRAYESEDEIKKLVMKNLRPKK